MPTYDAFCRAPLVNPALVPLSDSAVHVGGSLGRLIQRTLESVPVETITPLDSAIATKLGEYTELPAPPMLEKRAARLPEDAAGLIRAARAGLMIAAAAKDKDAMVRVLDAMRAFADALPQIGEAELLPVGADALRVSAELYRRTGQRFLLTLMARLRAQLPDVSGMFHSFPFLKAFTPEPVDAAATDEAAQYHRRMALLGTGALTADALAITAALAMFSGSARDAGASKAGLAALTRYHGQPNGTFSADPYLAGRDPPRATDLVAACAQAEALYDLLAASGDLSFAERLEILTENALANAFAEHGLRFAQSVNRLAADRTCAVSAPDAERSSALLRALYAVRRATWMAQAEDALCCLLPYPGGCLARMDGVPVRLTAEVSGFKTLTLHVECKQPVEFSLKLRVPAYAVGATVSVCGGKAQPVESGAYATLRRMYKTGDTVVLTLPCPARLETGYRGAASVYCGPNLMALPLPGPDAAWRYALDANVVPLLELEDDQPRARVDACDAPEWELRRGVIAPPPQGMRMGAGYELTLLPYADTAGRIAAFPQAGRRE